MEPKKVVERPAPKSISEYLTPPSSPTYITIVLSCGKTYFNLLDKDHSHPSGYPAKFCMTGFSCFIDENGESLYIRNQDISAYTVQEKKIPHYSD